MKASFLGICVGISATILVACDGGNVKVSSSAVSVTTPSSVSSQAVSSILASSSLAISSSLSSSSKSSSSVAVSSSSKSSAIVSSSSSKAAQQTSLQFKGVTLASAEFGEKSLPGIYDKDYVYPSQTEVDYFKSKKMNLLRLPFLWERLQPSLNQNFDQTEFNRLNEFVTATTAKNMYVVIDPHNYARYHGKLIGAAEVPVTAFADFWKRLATIYKNNDHVIFAIMNEPNTMPTEQWLTAAKAAAKAIRETGATNLMLVPGNSWTGAHSWTDNWYGTANAVALLDFVDPGNNYAIEAHQYFDADNSGTKPECSTATGSDKLVKFNAWLIANNKRGFLGEFAGANNDTCKKTIANVMQFLENNKSYWVGWSWWAAGPWWTWNDYMYSITPDNGKDAPQMSWLTPYLP